jgi:hypothetical protein
MARIYISIIQLQNLPRSFFKKREKANVENENKRRMFFPFSFLTMFQIIYFKYVNLVVNSDEEEFSIVAESHEVHFPEFGLCHIFEPVVDEPRLNLGWLV